MVVGTDGIPCGSPESSLAWFERELGDKTPSEVDRRAAVLILRNFELRRRSVLGRIVARLLELRETGQAEAGIEAYAVMDRRLYLLNRGVVPELDELKFDLKAEWKRLVDRVRETVR